MFKETIQSSDQCSATVTKGSAPDQTNSMTMNGYYTAVCYDSKGNVKWQDNIENLVTNVGKCLTLDVILANTSTPFSGGTGTVVMGLKGVGTPATTDTQALHPSWSEVGAATAPQYSGTRKYVSFSAASTSSNSKSTSACTIFTMTGSGTVTGCFININSSNIAIDNAAGTLFSVGDFTGGSKTVSTGDTLSVSYTASA